jgi:hypothetical protein
MSGTNLSSIVPGNSAVPGPGIQGPLEPPVVTIAAANPSTPSPSAAEPVNRQTIRIAKRSLKPSSRNPRRLDPIMMGARLIVGKTRGLFVRHAQARFFGKAPKERRAAGNPVKTRKQARWEPVVISTVFPRGPLALPSLGFLHDGLVPRPRRRRRRPAVRSRDARASPTDTPTGPATSAPARPERRPGILTASASALDGHK